jgi:hypothetical protein
MPKTPGLAIWGENGSISRIGSSMVLVISSKLQHEALGMLGVVIFAICKVSLVQELLGCH